MADLIVVCPSFGRPDAAKELFASFQQTRTSDSLLRFAVWNEDKAAPGYLSLPTTFLTHERMTPRTNAVARWAAERSRYVGWVADDNRFRTPGWDREVIAALETTPIVFGNDVVSPGSKPSQVFMDSRIVKALGWLVHPDLRSTFFDDVWANLGVGPIDVSRSLLPQEETRVGTVRGIVNVGSLGISYLGRVVVEHLYTERDNSADFMADMATYHKWLLDECETDIARCKRALRRRDALAPSTASAGLSL